MQPYFADFEELERRIRRCSKRDAAWVLEHVSLWRRWSEHQRSLMAYHKHRARDLAMVVTDQQTHIKNLEAELRPHLVRGDSA